MDDFGIKKPTKFDMPWNKPNQTKPNQTEPNQKLTFINSVRTQDTVKKILQERWSIEREREREREREGG